MFGTLLYLTIRCEANPVQSVGEVDTIEGISNIETYMSIDGAFVDKPNIEIVRK